MIASFLGEKQTLPIRQWYDRFGAGCGPCSPRWSRSLLPLCARLLETIRALDPFVGPAGFLSLAFGAALFGRLWEFTLTKPAMHLPGLILGGRRLIARKAKADAGVKCRLDAAPKDSDH